MPYKDKSRRKYGEATKYESTPAQKKNRAARNAARAEFMKKGLVHKGDGLDVNHKIPISVGGKPGAGNLNTETEHENRSYNRTKKHGVKYRGKLKK